MQHYAALSIRTLTLSTQAYHTIDHCIDALAANQTGLSYVVDLQGRHKASLQLFWTPPETGVNSVTLLSTSVLENAKAVGENAPAEKLLPASSPNGPSVISSGSSKSFLLDRQQDDDFIRIKIDTRPPLKYNAIIVINPLPPPAAEFTKWDSPCFKSQGGYCQMCEFPVQESGKAMDSTIGPYVCEHMSPGTQVLAIYRGNWIVEQSPYPGSRWIDFTLEQSTSKCDGDPASSCWGRLIDTSDVIREISAFGMADDAGTTSWNLRISHCQTGKDPTSKCATSGTSKLKVFTYRGDAAW
jgi:hypothetical protein